MYIHVCMHIVYHYWLVVSTPLKHISRWNDYSQYMEIRNAPNHQPDYVCLGMDLRERGVLYVDMCWGPFENLEYHAEKSKFHVKNYRIAWHLLMGGHLPMSQFMRDRLKILVPTSRCARVLCGVLSPKLYRVHSSTRIHQHTEMSKWMVHPCFEILHAYA